MIDDLLREYGCSFDRVTIIDNGLPIVEVPILKYSITVESGRIPRRQIEMEIDASEKWIPRHYYDSFHPQAELVFLAEKCVYDAANHTEYWLPLGTFMVDSTTIRNDSSGLTLNVTAPDKSAQRTWPMLGALAVPAMRAAEDVMSDVLKLSRSPMELVTQPTGYYFASSLIGKFGDSPVQLAQTIANQVGWEIYYDVLGTLRMQRLSVPTSAPVQHTWDLAEGDILTDIERTVDTSTIVDGVILQWSGGIEFYPDDKVKRPVVWDGDAALITTKAQAQQAAKAFLLKRQLGTATPMYTVACDPRVEINDIAKVVDAATGTNYTGRITSMTFASETPTMQVQLSNMAGA